MQAAWGINTMRERPVCSCGLWSFWRCGGMASVSGVLQWRGEYGLFGKYRRKVLGEKRGQRKLVNIQRSPLPSSGSLWTKSAKYAGRSEWMDKELLAKLPEGKVQRKWTQAHSGTQGQEKKAKDWNTGSFLWTFEICEDIWAVLRLPRKVVESPSLEILRNCLGMVLGKQVALLEQEGGCPEVSFNLNQSTVLWFCFTPKVNMEVEWCSNIFTEDSEICMPLEKCLELKDLLLIDCDAPALLNY